MYSMMPIIVYLLFYFYTSWLTISVFLMKISKIMIPYKSKCHCINIYPYWTTKVSYRSRYMNRWHHIHNRIDSIEETLLRNVVILELVECLLRIIIWCLSRRRPLMPLGAFATPRYTPKRLIIRKESRFWWILWLIWR